MLHYLLINVFQLSRRSNYCYSIVPVILQKMISKKINLFLSLSSTPIVNIANMKQRRLIKNIDSFKNIQIIMATMMPFDLMKSFYENYDLQRFQNITVGKDVQYTLPSFYQMHFMPYLAMYNKKGNLLATFEGAMKIEDLVHTFK